MEDLSKYLKPLKNYVTGKYRENFREPIGELKYQYLVPGCAYSHQLWDWDSWLTGLALMNIDDPSIEPYQKGCVLNFLNSMDEIGRMPILIQHPTWDLFALSDKEKNVHKPCLAQHALAISKHYGNSALWLKDVFDKLIKTVKYYENYQKDDESGLFYWIDDLGIGFDNDPTVFYRPYKSTGALYLNSLMYSELSAISELAKMLSLDDIAKKFEDKAKALGEAIRNECFDEEDGMFYSVDLSLRKVDLNEFLHRNDPRAYHSLPIKIKCWTTIMPLWNKVATAEQAQRVVEGYKVPDKLFSNYGIRSVSKKEKMYHVIRSGNPSCWTGPIWIIANYMAWIGFKNYGYKDLADDIRDKTIKLLGKDILEIGMFHEYYDPDTGEGVNNKGFQSWNMLVIEMVDEYEREHK